MIHNRRVEYFILQKTLFFILFTSICTLEPKYSSYQSDIYYYLLFFRLFNTIKFPLFDSTFHSATTYLNESMQQDFKLTPDSRYIPEILPKISPNPNFSGEVWLSQKVSWNYITVRSRCKALSAIAASSL